MSALPGDVVCGERFGIAFIGRVVCCPPWAVRVQGKGFTVIALDDGREITVGPWHPLSVVQECHLPTTIVSGMLVLAEAA